MWKIPGNKIRFFLSGIVSPWRTMRYPLRRLCWVCHQQ